MHTAQPDAAHHALITDLHAMLERYASMPVIERVAVLAQCIGQLTATVPGEHSSAEILQAIAMNIAVGNQNAGSTLAVAGHG